MDNLLVRANFWIQEALYEAQRGYPLKPLVYFSRFRPFPLAANDQVSDFFEGVDILKNIGTKIRNNVRCTVRCCVAYIS